MPEHYRIIFSKRVAADLEAILKRIAADSIENAARFVERILDAIEGLKTFPHRTVVEGQGRSKHPVRSLPVQSYIVFFRVMDEHRENATCGIDSNAITRHHRMVTSRKCV